MATRADRQLTAVVWRFYLLGELQVIYAGPQMPLPPPRTHALLAALLLNSRPQQRIRLVGLLFPDMPECKGRQRLSDRLWLLRRSLPDLPLAAGAEWIEMPAQSRWLDVDAFKLEAAGTDLAGWQAALALYRGDLLPDCFDDWLLLEREALHLEYVRRLLRTGSRLLERRQFEAALPLTQLLVQEEPFDEGALRTMMRAHTALGQRGAALAAYECFVELAADELGIEPGEATQSLAQAIRAAAPSPLPATPLPDDSSPERLLRQAQTALERGDWISVERCLRRLKSAPLTASETPVRLLEVDLALLYGDHDQAGQILEVCKKDQAAVMARRAALALARDQVTTAHDTASHALLLAHDEQNLPSELEALLVLSHTQRRLGQGTRALATAGQALNLARQCAS
ncbi:MAG: BTAD domain-containing putative transcriptional regulator, partial [Chloroflexota bacterium]|nr:BTAD domain-containing putative transcriptional regulator [Chloroflexota bacterium]